MVDKEGIIGMMIGLNQNAKGWLGMWYSYIPVTVITADEPAAPTDANISMLSAYAFLGKKEGC